jgi:hypothetical protein
MPKLSEEVLMRQLKRRLKNKEKKRLNNKSSDNSIDDQICDNYEEENIDNKRKLNQNIDKNKSKSFF